MLQQFLFGAVTPIQAADPDPGPLGDRRYRCVETLRAEHFPGRGQQPQIVPGGLGLPATLSHPGIVPFAERFAPLYVNGVNRSDNTMRAVVLHEFGPPSRLAVEEVPAPTARPGHAIIRVAAASVVFIDTQLRAGRSPNPAYQPALPIVPGNGVGGTVVAVGADIDDSIVGREFVSTTGGSGGYAELAAVSVDDMVPVPPGVSMIDAVALLADGRTAVGLARAARPAAGERVLIEAAGGGVGSLLVQLAAAAGAHVIGAASDGRKRDLARQLGAHSTVDYTASDWPDRVGPVDLVFDGVGGGIGQQAFELVRPGGRFCVMGAASGAMTKPPEAQLRSRQIKLVSLRDITATLPELIGAALDAAAAGTLRPTIGQQLPLDRAAEAHAAIEARATIGKTLLIP